MDNNSALWRSHLLDPVCDVSDHFSDSIGFFHGQCNFRDLPRGTAGE